MIRNKNIFLVVLIMALNCCTYPEALTKCWPAETETCDKVRLLLQEMGIKNVATIQIYMWNQYYSGVDDTHTLFLGTNFLSSSLEEQKITLGHELSHLLHHDIKNGTIFAGLLWWIVHPLMQYNFNFVYNKILLKINSKTIAKLMNFKISRVVTRGSVFTLTCVILPALLHWYQELRADRESMNNNPYCIQSAIKQYTSWKQQADDINQEKSFFEKIEEFLTSFTIRSDIFSLTNTHPLFTHPPLEWRIAQAKKLGNGSSA